MKSSLVCLVILASILLANPWMEGHFEGTPYPLPGTDDVIDSNPFDPAHLVSTALAIYGNYWVADDFTPAYDNSVASLTFWDLSTGTMPTSVDAYFWADLPPGPGAELWNGTISGTNLTHTYIGVTFGGYPIYMTVADLPNTDYFSVTGGTTYWTTIQRTDGTNFYCLLDDEVTGMCIFYNHGSGWFGIYTIVYTVVDMFRIIEGTVALERETWGAIKTQF